MKPLYTQEQFDIAKSNDKLPLECYYCQSTFLRTKGRVHLQKIGYIFKNGDTKLKYCNSKCYNKHRIDLYKNIVNCKVCNKEFNKRLSQIKRTKNNFCSQSCSATYNNKHKTHGTRRSKLEKWLEEQLSILYPKLNIAFNSKDVIDSELDIYIPSLNIAFELNGIFHYEPIYGVNKLNQIKNNDISKSKACHNAKIDLCIIDTSSQTYVKPKTSQKYLDIITNIIKERL